jgi:hypothetical protein
MSNMNKNGKNSQSQTRYAQLWAEIELPKLLKQNRGET